jgi:hypothetical protein
LAEPIGRIHQATDRGAFGVRNPFELDQAKIAEYEKKYKDAVQPSLSEDVQAVGAFQRTGQYLLTVPIIGQIGLVFYLLYQSFHKQRAGSLPMNFLLAVTPRKVHAFNYRQGGYGKIKLKHEVAVWERADIAVASTVDGAISSTVTFHVSEDGEPRKIICNTGKLSMNPWSASVLELLRRDAGSGTPGGADDAGSARTRI